MRAVPHRERCHRFRVLESCVGLLQLTFEHRIYVCNPATHLPTLLPYWKFTGFYQIKPTGRLARGGLLHPALSCGSEEKGGTEERGEEKRKEKRRLDHYCVHSGASLWGTCLTGAHGRSLIGLQQA
jgi:hypothetical protein